MIAIVDPWQGDAVVVGEGHAPAVAVLPGMRKKPLELMCAPKGIAPAPTSHFPCKQHVPAVPTWGPWRADHGPLQLAANGSAAPPSATVSAAQLVGRSCPRCGSTCARCEKRQSRPFRCPKDAHDGAPEQFPLLIGGFQRHHRGSEWGPIAPMMVPPRLS
jgi:hypothetical protein